MIFQLTVVTDRQVAQLVVPHAGCHGAGQSRMPILSLLFRHVLHHESLLQIAASSPSEP